MKKILSYILLCAGLFVSSCAKDENVDSAAGEGAIKFKIEVTNPDTRTYDPMQTLVVRIYREDGGLIRRYTSLDEIPENLYLVAGNYTISIDAGDKSPATWTNKTYHGEKAFTIRANQTVTEQVVCQSLNIGAKVSFDSSITDKMDKGAYVYVSASNTFDLAAIQDVPTLRYELSEAAKTGYFLLPEGVTNLSWSICGESTELGSVTQTGEIENVEALSTYKLKFQYSKSATGFGLISVQVDTDTEEHFDNILFSPQPSIKGDGFAVGETVGFHNNNIRFNVSSVRKLENVTMQMNGTTYTIFDMESQEAPQAGISYQTIDDNNGIVIIAPEFMSAVQTGFHPVTFNLRDINKGEGKGTFTIAMPGLLAVEESDFSSWNDAVTLKAIVTNPDAGNVKIAYRTNNGQWSEIEAATSGNCLYTARIAPSWSQAQNAKGNTVYTMANSGLIPGSTYEFRLSADGESGETKSFSTPDGNTIPTLNNNGLSCYTTNNTSDSNFWGSGNNGTTEGLCSFWGEMGGAQLSAITNTATNLVKMFAPGNLFSGTFKQDGMNGVVSFGNKYTFSARPKSLKVKYKGSIGTVSHNKHSGPLSTGSADKARIFVAIVDWTSPRKVTSGVNAPSGMWDPENGINAVSEGKIIGCGSIFLEGTVNELTELTLPIGYYDTELKPAAGRYSLVISCGTSAYGDYINGCKDNTMYVTDFTWEY